MDHPFDRRKFLRIASASLGFGALYRVAPLAAAPGAARVLDLLGKKNGERPGPFSFVQLSDTHVGSEGPANPQGTRAFEQAVERINALTPRPELVLVTGDLTHDSENPEQHADRMRAFRKIAANLKVPMVRCVPGEHDAGLDGGALFRDAFGETSYSFDHRGIHFVALDNVSRGKPVVGAEQLAWLQKDLARFEKTAPIVVFTHRPLFDLRPDWEWFTNDGDQVMAALSPYENVTVLYGHIHREDVHTEGHATHYAARSLCWAFPDPTAGVPKKPIPFDPKSPFANLGVRLVREGNRQAGTRPGVQEIELTLAEQNQLVGMQQFLKTGESL